MSKTKQDMRRVARAVAARTVPGRKKTDEQIQGLVEGLSPRRGGNETIEEYMVRFNKKYQGQKLDPTDHEFAETTAKTHWKAELKQEEKAEKKPLTKVERAAQAAAKTTFTNLDTDVTNGLYTVTRESTTEIQRGSGVQEWGNYNDFEAYAGGKTAAQAAEEAIAELDLSGSQSVAHARHDFQPSRPGVINLQVQLGGSRNWRTGKGDTSWTIVTIDEELWDAMKAADATRWKSVIQAAHRASLRDRQSIGIGPPADS